MKKVIAILFILVNTLLFFNTREVFMQKDFADMVQLHLLHPDVVHSTLMIDNLNNESISKETSDAMFDKFEQLTVQYDLTILHAESEKIYHYNWYVASNIPIDELFSLVTDVSLNFNEQDSYFYTNRRDLENGINFFLINSQLDVRISPMRAMGRIRGNTYTFVATSQADLESAVALFMDEFGDYVMYIAEFGSDPFVLEEEIAAFLPPIIAITMMLIFLIIIMYIHFFSKKIAIYKTMGLSFFIVIKELFLPLLIVIIVTIFTTQSLLFLFITSVINDRTIHVVTALINIGFLQLIGVIVTLIVGSLLILFIPTYSMLKNSSLNRFLMGANYVAKIVVLLLILPSISYRIDLIQENLQVLSYVRHYEQKGNLNAYQFSPELLPRYGGDGYLTLMINLSREFITDVDPSIIYEHDILYQYHLAYRILNEAGAILSDSSTFTSGEPVLNVNENYIRKHHIIDLDGNIVDLSQTTSDRVYLVPQIYLERTFVRDIISRGSAIIPIKNEQTVFDYGLGWRFWGIEKNPYVISVTRDSAFVLWASPLQDVFFDGDFNELLRETVFYNRMTISTVGYELNQIRNGHITELMNHTFAIVPNLLLVSVIIIQYSYLFLKVYKKRLYANKIMGHNPLRNLSQLLLESILAVIASILIAWYLRVDFRLIAVVVLLDLAVYLIVVAWFTWKDSLVFDYKE